ncbi:MAG: beta-ketoacyl synthase chain length factor [Myxococcales bacterium]|nr:beta-ketoacyl synthase chain length factor [Myxococcales bacterium]
MSGRVHVAGVGLYATDYPDLGAWSRGAAQPGCEPAGELIDRRARRRTSALTRALADAYGEALGASGFAADEVAAVFGSALGEAATMIGILDQIYGGKNVSPMRFAMSVHNAASGVVSTTTKNRGITTSIGADFDTPAMALIEGIGLVAAHEVPVVVVCGDEQAPDDLVQGLDLSWDMLAVALVLAPATGGGDGPLLRVHARTPEGAALCALEDEQPPRAVSARLARSPQVGLLDVVAALQRGQGGYVRLDRGRGRGYVAELLL